MTRPPGRAVRDERDPRGRSTTPAGSADPADRPPRTPTCPTRCGSPCGSRRPRRCWRAAAWSSCPRRTTWTTTPTSSTPSSCGRPGTGPAPGTASPAGHALSLSVALRAAAEVWPPLDRLQRQQVPDRMVLDADELADLLEHGLEALDGARRRRVLAARAARRAGRRRRGSRSPAAPREGQLDRGPVRTRGAVRLRLAARPGRRPAHRRRDGRAGRGHVAGDQAARQLDGDRPGRSPGGPASGTASRSRSSPVVALQAALTGTHLPRRRRRSRCTPAPPWRRSATASSTPPSVAPLATPGRAGGDPARLPAPRPHLAGRADRRRSRRLPGRRHGPGQDDHPDRAAPAPPPARAGDGPTLVVCPASLMGNWETEIRRFAPGVAVRRFHGTGARPRRSSTDGFVLTTYGTMRLDHEALGSSRRGTSSSPTRRSTSRTPPSSTARNLRTIESRCRVALTGTPVENNLTELWAILDWATPGLLGSRNAFRKVWAAPIESGVDPAVARRFAQLVEPFLLRRRKSDPGIAPELPAKTETDQVVGLTREQVVLYEALVRESMDRIERADEDTRRGLVLALLTGLKQICNHPAHYLRQAERPAQGPLGEARPVRRAARHDPGRERLGPGLHPVRRDGPAARAPPRRRLDPDPVPARRHPGARPRADGRATSRPAPPRSSCSPSRPAAPAST